MRCGSGLCSSLAVVAELFFGLWTWTLSLQSKAGQGKECLCWALRYRGPTPFSHCWGSPAPDLQPEVGEVWHACWQECPVSSDPGCSEVKDHSVYITCRLVTEKLITAINIYGLHLHFFLSLHVYMYKICAYIIHIYFFLKSTNKWNPYHCVQAYCGFRHGTGFLRWEWQLFRSDNWCTVSLKG